MLSALDFADSTIEFYGVRKNAVVNISMLKSSAADRKVAQHPRNKNRVREEEQLYLLREAANHQRHLNGQVRVATDGVANGMRPYVALRTGNGRYGQKHVISYFNDTPTS